jgi:hypothetical protein
MNLQSTILEFKKLSRELEHVCSNKKTVTQSVGAWFPNQLEQFLDTFNQPCDTVLLLDELWRYPESIEMVLNHSNLKNKNVFVVSTGYQNKQLGPRTWMITWPIYFLHNLNSVTDFTTKSVDLKIGFNCLNNGTQVHRILLGYQLYQHGLLDQVLFTQNNQGSLDALILDTFPNMEEYTNLLPILLLDQHDSMSTNAFKKAKDFAPYVYHYSHHDSYCNIVTESETDGFPYQLPLEIITEKSYKPFVAKQIPIMLAGRGHIAYLKSLGFEMMEDLLPLNYDYMWTDQKISAIVDVVAKGPEFIKDFYFDHTQEINHNHELWFSGKIKQTILQRIQNIIV